MKKVLLCIVPLLSLVFTGCFGPKPEWTVDVQFSIADKYSDVHNFRGAVQLSEIEDLVFRGVVCTASVDGIEHSLLLQTLNISSPKWPKVFTYYSIRNGDKGAFFDTIIDRGHVFIFHSSLDKHTFIGATIWDKKAFDDLMRPILTFNLPCTVKSL